MTQPRHFGTDGIRGVANTGLLAPENLVSLGRAMGRLAKHVGRPRIALAQDPRKSSPLLACALSAGASSEGVSVLDLGVLPTPGLAALLPGMDVALGAMVSASHNPMQDNGIKVFDGSGAKLSDDGEVWLETEMTSASTAPPPIGVNLGSIEWRTDAADTYIAYLLAHAKGLDLSGMMIAVDAANGATHAVGPRLFRELGARVVAICAEPDGVNINENCGAVHPERLARTVLEQRADIGFAFDGDGDRAILVGSDGSIQDGDRILYACGMHMKSAGELEGNVLVATVMSNFGLELACADQGIRLQRTAVGDRHVVAAMRKDGWQLGGEQSGHIIFGDQNRWIGDGLFTAIKACQVMSAAGKPFEQLSAAVTPVPQVLLNVRVSDKPPLEDLPDVTRRIEAGESKLAGSGRVVVRYSGTEKLLRVMVEGRDDKAVDAVAADIAKAVRAAIGAGPTTSVESDEPVAS